MSQIGDPAAKLLRNSTAGRSGRTNVTLFRGARFACLQLYTQNRLQGGRLEVVEGLRPLHPASRMCNHAKLPHEGSSPTMASFFPEEKQNSLFPLLRGCSSAAREFRPSARFGAVSHSGGYVTQVSGLGARRGVSTCCTISKVPSIEVLQGANRCFLFESQPLKVFAVLIRRPARSAGLITVG